MSDKREFIFCDVLTDESDKSYYYLSDIIDLCEGDIVEVPFGDVGKKVKGTVMKIGKYTLDNAPYPPNKTKYILRKVPEDERPSEDGNFLLNCGGTVLERYIGQGNNKIVIPEGIIEIRPRAFANLQTLNEVVLPNSLKIIGNEAFGCTGIKKVIIPDGVEQIGFAAFTYKRDEQSQWGSVNYRQDLNSAEMVVSKKHPYFISDGKCIFRINDDGTKDLVQCFKTGITKYDVPEDTVSIYEAAFLGCTRLSTLNLNEGLKSIGREAVKYCSNNMLSIQIPDSLEDMSDLPYTGRTVSKTGYGYYKYNSNSKLEILTLDTNPRFLNDDGNLYKITESDELQLLSCSSSASRIDIKEGTLSILERAFAYCEHLKEVVIPSSMNGLEDSEDEWYFPESVTKIEVDDSNKYLSAIDGILYDKNQTRVLFVPEKIAFKELVLPETVRDIGTAFEHTQKINSIVLPEGLKKLSRNAFNGCKIRSFTVPQSLTEVDSRAFVLSQDISSAIVYGAPGSVMEAYCKTRKKLSFVAKKAVSNKPKEKINYEYKIGRTGVALTKYIGSSRNLLLPSEIEGKPVTEVKKIFKFGNNSINSIELPSSVVKLETGAFSDLYGLTKLKLSENLSSIPDKMCMNCESLTDITIPDSVTSIGELAFAKSGIKTLSLPAHLKSISAEIIYGCRNLTELVLPEGVEEICDGAFYGIEVNRIVIPASVSKISDLVFADTCNFDNYCYRNWSLSKKTFIRVVKDSYADKFFTSYINAGSCVERSYIKDNLKIVYDEQSEDDAVNLSLFTICESKDGCIISDIAPYPEGEIIIPEKINGLPVTSVNIQAPRYDQTPRYDVKKYASIDFPKNVTKIYFDMNVFVSKVTFTHGNDTFWSDGSAIYSADKSTLLFLADRALKSYTVLEGVKRIGDYAFKWCNNLTVRFPSSLTHLEPSALRGIINTISVSGGENIDAPENGSSKEMLDRNTVVIGVLGKTLMHADPKLKVVIVPEGVEIIGAGAFSKIGDVWSGTDCLAEEIVLPATVRILESRCFAGLENLKKINLPEGIETIPNSAFSYCRKLEYIKLPESVRSIETNAFSNCSSLTNIDLPSKLETIGDDVFHYCDGLISIMLPAGLQSVNVTSLGESELEMIHVAPENDTYSDKDGVLFSKDGQKLIRVPVAYNCKDYIIPDCVTEVGPYAFRKCKNIRSIVFHDNISKIGEYVCSEMESLMSVRLPSGLKALGKGWFRTCFNLKTVIWPKNFTSIGDECFSICRNMTPYLPKSLETIGRGALEGTNLKKFTITKSLTHYESCCGYWVDSNPFEVEVYDNAITSELNSIMRAASIITVKSTESGTVLYKVWTMEENQPDEVVNVLQSCWNNNGTFNFKKLDTVFQNINGMIDKAKTALYRLSYPISLTPENEEMYRSYITKMGAKMITRFIEDDDLESIRNASQFNAIKKSNISNLLEIATSAKKTEIAAFLLNYKNELLK